MVTSCVGPDLTRARRRFWPELVVRYTPWIALVVGLVAWSQDDFVLLAQAATVTGVGLFVRTAFRCPPGGAATDTRITSLLPRLDASPVTGLPVQVRGRVIGRGVPGYVLSPDVVVQDGSGFVPVLYWQPWPFARSLFGLLGVPDLLGQDVVVRGWYRRNPAPVLELRTLVAERGRPIRGIGWIGSYLLAVLLALAGGAGWLALT